MCYIVEPTASLGVSSLPPSCSRVPSPPQFSQSGAQRLRFTVASRSSARAASAPRPRVRYFRSPARLLAREARFCFESDPVTIHSIQTPARFSERDLHGLSLERKRRRERFRRCALERVRASSFRASGLSRERFHCGRSA
jgi:hypothetical protein